LREELKQFALALRRHTNTAVLDGEDEVNEVVVLRFASVNGPSHDYLASLGRELHRIAQQVGEDLLQAMA
jgi:hypothetical protein